MTSILNKTMTDFEDYIYEVEVGRKLYRFKPNQANKFEVRDGILSILKDDKYVMVFNEWKFFRVVGA